MDASAWTVVGQLVTVLGSLATIYITARINRSVKTGTEQSTKAAESATRAAESAAEKVEEVAKVAAETTRDQAGKLDTIHVLVNSNLAAEKTAKDAALAEALRLRGIIAGISPAHPDGKPPEP